MNIYNITCIKQIKYIFLYNYLIDLSQGLIYN